MNNDVFAMEKVRLVVVDDEALIRERFRYAYPLEEYGYEIVGEAEDGEEALALCLQTNPDIVITDIVMPRMDGLELTEKLRTAMPRVKVIILSSFQEFEFARKAVSLGALGYLLKVTSGYQELLAILEKARKEIEGDRESMLAAIEERKHLLDSRPLLRKQLLLDIKNGAIEDAGKLNAQCDFVRWHRPAQRFSLGIVNIDRYDEFSRTFHDKDIALFRYALMSMIEEIADKYGPCNVFPWEHNNIGLWIQHPEGDGERLDSLAREISQSVRQYLPFSVSIRLSSIHKLGSSPQQWTLGFKDAYAELEVLLTAQFYGSQGGMHLYSTPASPDANGANETLALPDPAPLLAELSYDAQLPRLIRDIYVDPMRRSSTSPDYVRDWCRGLAKRWTAGDPQAQQRLKQIGANGLETIQDVEEFLMGLFAWKRSDRGLAFDQPVQRAEIQKALDYVSVHYRNPISVAEVSEHIAMSPNYFSHLFKVQTGINFSEYVTRFRIEMSKQLLVDTELQVHDIAERTGIPDYKYFARIFRRLVGMTPSQYRKEQMETSLEK
ncbi:response regulator [Paenibacillus sp. PAMC21692]|uniref:response regulator transcription factor n=1 Tax=Paenibacillus sp. PAMC21692 TaxID=2762320 RepID=UPI00164DC9EA|nr:response regulator [Paenibacillus sp. PAMC21692]QNK55645.1 response regulator [Paenibacillus sp. PAMC21692]